MGPFTGCRKKESKLKRYTLLLVTIMRCYVSVSHRLSSENVEHKTHFRLNFNEMLIQTVYDVHVKWHTVLYVIAIY